MSDELEGKVALVTGASRGMGGVAARALAEEGRRGHSGGAGRRALRGRGDDRRKGRRAPKGWPATLPDYCAVSGWSAKRGGRRGSTC